MRGTALSRGVLSLALGLLFEVTASAEPSPAVRSIAESRHAGVVMQEWDSSCGAAALATLLTYDLGDPVTEESVAREMLAKTSPDEVASAGGFSLLDLQTFAHSRGYEAEGYGNLTLADLEARAPAIIPLILNGYPHFVVFRGLEDGRAVLADPAFGRRLVRVERLEQSWAPKVAFVVEGTAPAKESQSTALPSDDPEKASTRALERALLRQSGMVLMPWSVELSPEATYAYGSSAGFRRDRMQSLLGVRLGLPLRLQVDASVPWILFDTVSGEDRVSGLGDATVGLTSLLLTERKARPALLARAEWKTATGSAPEDGSRGTGTGAHSLLAQVSAVKRDDPVVFLGALYRAWNLPSGDVDLGDTTGALLSALLAATPSTSFSIELDVGWVERLRRQGEPVPGSDQVSAVATFAMYTSIAPKVLLNLNASVGLTDSVPDLQLGIALPIRFSR